MKNLLKELKKISKHYRNNVKLSHPARSDEKMMCNYYAERETERLKKKMHKSR